MNLQAPYLGNQIQEAHQASLSPSTISRLADALLSRLGGAAPLFRETLEVHYPQGTQAFPLVLDEGGWIQILDRWRNPRFEQFAGFVREFTQQDRILRYELPRSFMEALFDQLALALAGDLPTRVTGEITVFYDNSFDYRGSGFDLGSPAKDW